MQDYKCENLSIYTKGRESTRVQNTVKIKNVETHNIEERQENRENDK